MTDSFDYVLDTPINYRALTELAKIPPVDAVVDAWTNAGENPHWHEVAKYQVRRCMPLLAEALELLAEEEKNERGLK